MKCSVFAMAVSASSPALGDAYSKLLSLEGRWEIQYGNEVSEVTYEVKANGSALIEKFMDMVTIYHKNGSEIMATHFCSKGNQPRLVAPQENQNTSSIKFDFVDLTNDDSSGHISGVKFDFIDSDHFTQTWTERDSDGNESLFSLNYKRLPSKGNLGIVITPEMKIMVSTMKVSDLDEVEKILANQLPKIASYINNQSGTISGSALLRVIKFEEDEKIFEYGFPVHESVANTEAIKAKVIPASLAVKAEHYGYHETLPETHEKISTFLNESGLSISNAIWESYITDLETTPWFKTLTEVYYPVHYSN